MLFAQDLTQLAKDVGPWAPVTLAGIAALWRLLSPLVLSGAEWIKTNGVSLAEGIARVANRQVLFIDEMSKGIPVIFEMRTELREMRDDIKSMKAGM